MNEFILYRALFFLAMFLLAALIVAVFSIGSAIVSLALSQSKKEPEQKADDKRKWKLKTVFSRNREDPFPESTTLTIDNCWLHRI